MVETARMRAVVAFADPVAGTWAKGQTAVTVVTDRVVALVEAGYLEPDWAGTPPQPTPPAPVAPPAPVTPRVSPAPPAAPSTPQRVGARRRVRTGDDG